MVRNRLISHKAALTESVEEMTGAVGYEAIAYMLDAATGSTRRSQSAADPL